MNESQSRMLVLYYTIGDESTPGGGYIRPSSIYQRTNTTKRRYDNRVRGYRLLVLGNALYLHTEYRILMMTVIEEASAIGRRQIQLIHGCE